MVSRCCSALPEPRVMRSNGGVAAADVLTERLDSDAELVNRLPESQQVVVAEGRIGNNQSNGDFEMDLGASTRSPQTQADFVWPNGSAVGFVLQYDSVADAYAFILAPDEANETTLSVGGLGGISDVFFRTAAYIAGTTLTLDNLTVNGESIPGLVASGDGDARDHLHVGGGGVFSGDWTIAGDATKTWTGRRRPTRSSFFRSRAARRSRRSPSRRPWRCWGPSACSCFVAVEPIKTTVGGWCCVERGKRLASAGRFRMGRQADAACRACIMPGVPAP